MRYDKEWFLKRVQKTDACWYWISKKPGYGRIEIWKNGEIEKRWLAHRYSWKLHCGEIPDGLWVLHKCDNPKCVRPEHLFLGTGRDNAIDMWQKGRGPNIKGEKHGRCTISNATATRIKEMLSSKVPNYLIARELKVPVWTVENIKYGNSFSWLS